MVAFSICLVVICFSDSLSIIFVVVVVSVVMGFLVVPVEDSSLVWKVAGKDTLLWSSCVAVGSLSNY